MGIHGKKLTHKRKECIGCYSCVAIASELFSMNNEDGKADMKKSKKKGEYFVREIDEVEKEKAIQCEKTCPAGIIRIEDKKYD